MKTPKSFDRLYDPSSYLRSTAAVSEPSHDCELALSLNLRQIQDLRFGYLLYCMRKPPRRFMTASDLFTESPSTQSQETVDHKGLDTLLAETFRPALKLRPHFEAIVIVSTDNQRTKTPTDEIIFGSSTVPRCLCHHSSLFIIPPNSTALTSIHTSTNGVSHIFPCCCRYAYHMLA